MSLSAWESNVQLAIVYAIFALSLYAPLSAGVLSVASVSSGALGGFLLAVMMPASGVASIYTLLLAALIGGAAAFIMSFVLLRLDSHYLAFATIALILVTYVVVLNASSVTGGAVGRVAAGTLGWAYLCVALVVCCWTFARIRLSRTGLAATVVRADPLVASGIGINPRHIQRALFTVGGTVAGVAGALLASLLEYVDPTTFYTPLAFTSLAAVVLGGAYYWQGAVIGAFVFTLLPYLLQEYFSANLDQVADGVVIIAIVIFFPGGLIEMGKWIRLPELGRLAAVGPGRPAAGQVLDTEKAQPTSLPAGTAGTVQRGRPDLAQYTARKEHDGAALEVRSLTKIFGGLRAVDGLSLAVPTGSIFGVLGPNGAGKTTFINLLSGVLPPDEGATIVLGQETTGWPAYRVARLGLARTYQNIRLSQGLSVLETIMSGSYSRQRSTMAAAVAALPGERRERRACADEARHLMEVVGMSAAEDRRAATLAYGEQRRVEIARALASHPAILLLDEPTAGMNAQESAQLGELLRSLSGQGITIVLIEHNIRLVSEFCTHAAVMHSGSLIATGRPDDCLAQEEVQLAYFGRRSDAERLESLRILRSDPGD
jgi:ABC-type branched-subunit amino acid transport system ATPase component/ABC-type branched-subunit amino acid transport system permease subunit